MNAGNTMVGFLEETMKRLAALLFCIALPAHATLVDYRVNLMVDSIAHNNTGSNSPPHPFKAGDQFFAHLTVDDSILATDGKKAGKITNFYSAIGLSVWDQNRRHGALDGNGSDFVSFRGPCAQSDQIVNCLGSEFLLFDVLEHQIDGLFGGVIGPSDFPFIDFLGDRFSVQPHYWLLLNVRQGGDITPLGTLNVPEPAPIALMLLALWVLRRQGVTT